jgi:hypothetical protein
VTPLGDFFRSPFLKVQARLARNFHHRFDHGLDDTLNLLTCGSRAALPRQQSLRATLDWSYARLSATEQAFLARLSVLPAGSHYAQRSPLPPTQC